MAHELDSQGQWQRLYGLYHAMSDEELLGLAEGIEDLTDEAGDVLRREMKDRRLQVEQPATQASASASKWWSPGADKLGQGEVALVIFHDAFAAGGACECLEHGGVAFQMRDVSSPRSGLRSFEGRPPVALELSVARVDRERAMAILRKKMGLFPLQEVAEADDLIDDGTLSILGAFGRREDAEDIARILDDARVWHRIVANPDGTVENDDCYTLEVREVDVTKAADVVEKAMEFPEA